MKKLLAIATVKDWFDSDALYAAEKLLRPNEKLYYIKPDDFLALAKSFNKPGGSLKKKAGIQEVFEKGERLKTLPYLRIEYNVEVDPKTLATTRNKNVAIVVGHEGRHRNVSLKNLGYDKIPVIIKFQNMNSIPKYIINQDDNKKFVFDKVLKPYE